MAAIQATTGARRILVLIPGRLGDRMSGPEIRGWQLASVLSERYEVTAAVRSPEAGARDGVRLVPFSRPRILREALRSDAVVSSSVPPYVLATKARRPLLAVSDQYDPIDLELASLQGAEGARMARSGLTETRLQLRFADVVLCANERQRRRVEHLLEEQRRRGWNAPEVLNVPYGLPPPPPPARAHPLREQFPQIAESDTVVLWWGAVWRWLDADTAIRALAPLVDRRPDIKLVFATGRGKGTSAGRLDASEEVRSLAHSLGVLDRTVLFWEGWVPYERRHELLLDADIGLTLHPESDETSLSARARYLDYLWTALPCVLARGDETGAEFERAGYARLVPPGDADAVRAALLDLADDSDARAAAGAAARSLARSYEWRALIRPLGEVLSHAPRRLLRGSEALRFPFVAGAYYAGRVGDEVVSAWARRYGS